MAAVVLAVVVVVLAAVVEAVVVVVVVVDSLFAHETAVNTRAKAIRTAIAFLIIFSLCINGSDRYFLSDSFKHFGG